MAYKDSRDFRSDYPKGYSRNGDVYDGNGHKIGYVTGDGDYRINDGSANDRQLYHNGGDDDDDWVVPLGSSRVISAAPFFLSYYLKLCIFFQILQKIIVLKLFVWYYM